MQIMRNPASSKPPMDCDTMEYGSASYLSALLGGKGAKGANLNI
jgi:hypothetical protein